MPAIVPTFNVVFWGIVTFSLLVVLHEGGHFIAARLFRVKVHEFMIGLPGPAIRLKTKSTSYGITAIPLGGYVRIAGMEPGTEDPLLGPALMVVTTRRRATDANVAEALSLEPEHAEKLLITLADWGAISADPADKTAWVAEMTLNDAEDEQALLSRARSVTYRGRKTWQRITMLAAGVFVNLLAAILTFTIVLSIYGYFVPSLVIDETTKGSPAREAGLRSGDRIVSIGSTQLKDWNGLITTISAHKPGDQVRIIFVRNGRQQTATAKLESVGGKPRLGIASRIEHKYFSVPGAVVESLRWTGLVFVAVADFFRPSTFVQSVGQARSVIGISQEVAKAVKQGPLDYAWLVAFLSLSLGCLNILPIPPLDGGKAAMELIERVMGHPMKREVYMAISATGAILLFTLIAYLMYADVVRIVTNG